MKVTGVSEFKRRRSALLSIMEPGSIAMVPSAVLSIRNRYVTHPFRQDSDFYYLTGFKHPGACLVLIPGRDSGESILFCPEVTDQTVMWHGEHISPENAPDILAVDDAFPIEDIDDILPGLLETRQRIYCNMGHQPDFDTRLLNWIEQLDSKKSGEFSDLSYLLHEQRLKKSTREQASIRKAAKISAKAHNRAMKAVHPGLYEYQLDAEIQHEFAMSGARRAAYISIVASGINACTLHYMENSKKMQDGELVLVDAGCEFDYYASDITRTYPVSGVFTDAQRTLYDLVLKSQLAAIEQIIPGNSFEQSHDAAYKAIYNGLVAEGIIETGFDIKDWFMHRTAHWLGMDVHDVGDYRIGNTWRMLEPGMVMAVEPGLYIPQNEIRVAPKWRGIGIRIEDVVLVTKNGNEVLSEDAIKDPGEIERWMNHGQASLF